MNLIVAVDENWGIGKDNELLCCISADFCQNPFHYFVTFSFF